MRWSQLVTQQLMFVCMLRYAANALICVTQKCSSYGFAIKVCRLYEENVRIYWISVKKQYSSTRCIRHRNFGYQDDSFWVSKGCRAKFVICFGSAPVPICSDTCSYPIDGACDDGGPGSLYSLCDLGTDCTDCGNRYNGSGVGGTNSIVSTTPTTSSLAATNLKYTTLATTGIDGVDDTTTSAELKENEAGDNFVNTTTDFGISVNDIVRDAQLSPVAVVGGVAGVFIAVLVLTIVVVLWRKGYIRLPGPKYTSTNEKIKPSVKTTENAVYTVQGNKHVYPSGEVNDNDKCTNVGSVHEVLPNIAYDEVNIYEELGHVNGLILEGRYSSVVDNLTQTCPDYENEDVFDNIVETRRGNNPESTEDVKEAHEYVVILNQYDVMSTAVDDHVYEQLPERLSPDDNS